MIYSSKGKLFPCALGSKAPLHKAHRELEYTPEEIQDYRDRGHAIGWLVPADVLVIDVDPRNGGDESFEKLSHDIGLVESEHCIVDTPTGGKHVYLKKREPFKNRKTVKGFPGIDFISVGSYVLTEGSPHPNGGIYRLRAGDALAAVSGALRGIVERVTVEAGDNEAGEYNHHNLEAVLQCIPVDAYHGDREGWFQIMAASHFATGGCPEAREVFLNWCCADGRYEADRQAMSNQWDLLVPSGIQTGTLVNALADHTDQGFANRLFGSFKDQVSVDNSDFDEIQSEEIEVDETPFGVMTLRDVMSQKIEVEYLIENFMTRLQPMVIGGAAKTLKTSTTIDIVLSLASGTKCLNKFDVNGKYKVLLLSAESGLGTLQEKFKAAIRAKGVEDDALDRIYLGDRVPRLDSLDDVIQKREGKTTISVADGIKLKRFIMENGIDVVFIDPLYLALPSEESANLQAQGALLLQFVTLMLDVDCTPILLHHAKKTIQGFKPLNLSALSGAGIAEFTRQWVLVSRRSEYTGNGRHDLHFVWGGSAGHSGYEFLDIDEGCRSLSIDKDFEDLGDNVLGEYTKQVTGDDGINRDWRRWDLTWSDPEAENKPVDDLPF